MTYTYVAMYIVTLQSRVSLFNPVTLLGGTDNGDFRGFMIQGRVVADDSRAGQFTGEPGVSQPQCTNDVSSADDAYRMQS